MHSIAVLKIITPNPGPYHLSFHLRGLKTEFFLFFGFKFHYTHLVL
jgi:hypothetical protein